MGEGMDLEAIKKDGSKFPVEISLSPVTTESGILVLATVRDITRRKIAEQNLAKLNAELEQRVKERTNDLQRSEAFTRGVLDSINAHIAVVDSAGKIITVNYAWKKFAMENGDLTLSSTGEGINYYDVCERAAKEGDVYADKVLRGMKEVMYGSLADFYMEYPCHSPEEERWFSLRVMKFNTTEPMVVISHQFVTERKKAEIALLETNNELRNLASHLQNVREEERMHIAREIHDELGQQLTGLKMDVHGLRKKLIRCNEEILQKVDEIVDLTSEIVNSVRRISSNLRPSVLDDLGLVAALEWLSMDVAKKSSIKIEFTCHQQDIDLSVNIATGVFRIYQEALNNAVKHANANHIFSSLLKKDNTLFVSIRDDGKGFDVQESATGSTFGLIGMKERAYLLNGKFEIRSDKENGTQINIIIPIIN